MRKLEEKLREVVIKVAIRANGTSSLWGMHQPEEPHTLLAELKQMRKNK
ncbi:MAG: cyclic lactone autoinducer peptide [Paenibacillaceae bacterium]|nr:cyclic lactone autoinducer peptide [Paenibacillaceae bacterium]